MSRERELVMEIQVAGRTFYEEEETLTIIGDEAEILEAYFAEKTVKEESLKDGKYQYTFDKLTSTDSKTKRSNVAKAIHKSINDELSSQHKEVKLADITKVINEKETGKKWPLQSHAKDSTVTFDQYKKETKIYYKKITSAPMGYQVYLITETKNLKDKKVKLKIHEKESDLKLLKTKDDILPVLVFAKKEDTTSETEASDWIEIDVKEESGNKEDGHLFLYKEENENKIEVGIKKIQLRPKEDKIKTEGEDAHKSFEGWQEALYIRENETEEGKKAIKEAEDSKAVRDAEKDTIQKFDKDAKNKTYPAGDIDAPKTAIAGKAIEYILNIDINDKNYRHKDKATEEDKNNIRWSFFVQGEAKTDKESTYIKSKSKTGLYTYAKTEVLDGKNKLTIVFDEALKGKKVQIEPFRGSPGLSTKPEYVRTTTVQEVPEPKIVKRETTTLWLTSQCESVENAGEMIDKDFENYFKLETPGLLFPFNIIPLNHPDNFKNKYYKPYNYRLKEHRAPTFGVLRSALRIHAARDLYSDVGEPIYAIADGVVTNIDKFYRDTWRIEIEHEYEVKFARKKGHRMVVRYGEVKKGSAILVKKGQRVFRGDKIAEVGLLVPHVHQPAGEKRGMLHIEFYTGEESGALNDYQVTYADMLYAKSGKYNGQASFQRRKDLFDGLDLLDKMLETSKKENRIK